jgi:amidohydrolase
MGGHVTPELAGTLSLTHGTAYSRSDSWNVTVRGKGGHGSRPEACIDPIVCLAYSIVRLQSIVSRAVPSTEAGVITVGQIEGGEAENVIPDFASMKINIRSNSDKLADLIDGEIRRVVASEVKASNPTAEVAWSAEDQEKSDANPHFKHISSAPLLKNEDCLREAVSASFADIFGKAFNGDVPGISGSEDIAHLAKLLPGDKEPTIPLLYWRYGGTSQETWDDNGGDVQKVPSNHSSNFKPQLEQDRDNDTLKVGTQAFVVAALTKFNLGGTAGFVLI